MNLDQKVQVSLTVLLTGFVIVFAMLIFLTFMIKGYGMIIRAIEAKIRGKSALKADPKPVAIVPAEKPEAVIEEGISDEVIAVISTAVYAMYGSSASTVTSIRRVVQSGRSAWGMVGLWENTHPF